MYFTNVLRSSEVYRADATATCLMEKAREPCRCSDIDSYQEITLEVNYSRCVKQPSLNEIDRAIRKANHKWQIINAVLLYIDRILTRGRAVDWLID